jgi:hypothetical protein
MGQVQNSALKAASLLTLLAQAVRSDQDLGAIQEYGRGLPPELLPLDQIIIEKAFKKAAQLQTERAQAKALKWLMAYGMGSVLPETYTTDIERILNQLLDQKPAFLENINPELLSTLGDTMIAEAEVYIQSHGRYYAQGTIAARLIALCASSRQQQRLKDTMIRKESADQAKAQAAKEEQEKEAFNWLTSYVAGHISHETCSAETAKTLIRALSSRSDLLERLSLETRHALADRLTSDWGKLILPTNTFQLKGGHMSPSPQSAYGLHILNHLLNIDSVSWAQRQHLQDIITLKGE